MGRSGPARPDAARPGAAGTERPEGDMDPGRSDGKRLEVGDDTVRDTLDPGEIYGGRADAAGAEDVTPGVSGDAAG